MKETWSITASATVPVTAGATGGNLRRFLRYARPYRWVIVAATLVGLAKFNLPVLFPWILRSVVDDALAGRAGALGLGLGGLMGLATGVFLAYAVASHLRTFLADRIAQSITFDVRRDLFGHLHGLPIEFFHERSTGAIFTRLFTDVATAQSFVGAACTNVFMELSALLAIAACATAMNERLALVAFATLPVFALVHKRLGGRMRAIAHEARRRMEPLEGRLQETVAGIEEVKCFVRDGEESRRFEEGYRHYLRAAFANVSIHALSLGATALLTRIPSVIVVWVGAHMVLDGALTVGELLAFYAYLEMVYGPLARLADFNVVLASSRAAIDRLFEFLDMPSESVIRPGTRRLTATAGEIRFEGVTFGYVPGLPVLRGLDLRIEPDQIVALVGRSGAGKSTLVRLLLRLHDPWSGRILVDGQDLREVDVRSLRSQIAVVRQSPVLFSGTIAENIRFGCEQASMEEVVAAAESANLLEVVRRLPEGFDTPIGERGVRLSGGERQRIAIARAFLEDAPILILDESTSELDETSARAIHEALERLVTGRTTLVVTHRASTRMRAHRVVTLADGVAREARPGDPDRQAELVETSSS